MIWHHIDDLCALLIIIGSFIVIFTGIDGHAWGLLGVAAGWAFHKGATAASAKVKQ